MIVKTKFYLAAAIIIALSEAAAYTLESNQILIIANKDIKESVGLAKYYCVKRNVPADNIILLSLGKSLEDEISRDDYNRKIAEPVRSKLLEPEFFKTKCLLTTYGVPFRVGKRGVLENQKEELQKLQERLEQEKLKLEQLKNQKDVSLDLIKEAETNISILQSQIDLIEGLETNASVDSELSMVLAGNYELYRWQVNELKSSFLRQNSRTLCVSRLDGPTAQIARGLVDKALTAEKNGLQGKVYIDSGYSEQAKYTLAKEFDDSLRQVAALIKEKTKLPVIEETTGELFKPGQCPSTAIYCGWYSLKKYIDSFEFTDGAIGIHIASLEAVNLRDANSSQWCPSMLKKGVSVTIGAVAEPYLHTFPRPMDFFAELLEGRCIAEAFYYSKPYNSWQLVLIGDPLYQPFKVAD